MIKKIIVAFLFLLSFFSITIITGCKKTDQSFPTKNSGVEGSTLENKNLRANSYINKAPKTNTEAIENLTESLAELDLATKEVDSSIEEMEVDLKNSEEALNL